MIKEIIAIVTASVIICEMMFIEGSFAFGNLKYEKI